MKAFTISELSRNLDLSFLTASGIILQLLFKGVYLELSFFPPLLIWIMN